jgi:transketolase
LRRAFSDALLQAATEDDRVIFLTGDLGFGVFDEFIERFPRRYINVGVAEAQLVTCAAGLALEGWKPIVYSIASFMTGRAWEQIRIAVGYHELPVVVIGAGGGYTYASSGVTHHAKEDLALMSLIPGMAVLAPGDPCEITVLLGQLLQRSTPGYMRVGRFGEPKIESDTPIKVGVGRIIRKGERVCVVTTGSSVIQALEAADTLALDGIHPTICHFHTLSPFDNPTFLAATANAETVVVVEDHGIQGGLAVTVQMLISSGARRLRLIRLGPNDEPVFGNPSHEELRKRMHYDAKSIAAVCAEYYPHPSPAQTRADGYHAVVSPGPLND